MFKLLVLVIFAFAIYLGIFKVRNGRWPWNDHDIKPTGGEGE
ncbi:MAG TPA: hypothetical protein PLV67_05595 [Methanofastidiosum sp.]|jgi:hypothetical protein|nr:hypothetical protein [Methanofastidiosum sp.]